MRFDQVVALERPILGFDLETTGTNKKTARIVELGLEIMEPGAEPVEFRTLINPGIPIPHEASHGNGGDYPGHGITDEMVKDAPTFASIAARLAKRFTGVDFIGFNIRFDVQIAAAEFARAGITWDYEDARLVCGHRLWQVAKPRSLEDFAREFIPDEREALSSGAHNALGDIRWSTRGTAALIQAYVNRPLEYNVELPRSVQELHGVCWPDWFDAEGKLRWRSGVLVMGFGEHRDVPLADIPDSYKCFILRKDFSAKVKDAVRDARNGIYPTAPARAVTEGGQ